MNDDPHELERMRAALEASGRYRVLVRYRKPERYRPAPGPDIELLTGLYVDVETTGLSAASDSIIELGLVAFEFDRDGRVYALLDELSAFEDPGRSIPPEISRITGITDDMVAGQRLPDREIDALVEGAQLVIAHNASFDRPFLERRLPVFAERAWACSAHDVPWRAEGFEGRKLEYLAMKQGFFYDGHRAANDCLAGVHLLTMPLPKSGGSAFQALLERARRTGGRLYAVDSPFEAKDRLKARGYRWNGRVWYRDLPPEQVAPEAEWLRADIYNRAQPLPVFPLSAFVRYSERIPDLPPGDARRV